MSDLVDELDQFYTHPKLAQSFASKVLTRWSDPDVLFVEPSAGDGAFLNPLIEANRKVRAVDLDPQTTNIQRKDFLEDESIFWGKHSAIVVVGNPPFGKNACMAVRFFNHAAKWADEIAFIVPRTFRKGSVHKRLHKHFHLTIDKEIKKYAFLRDGVPHDVPCAWQIWTRKVNKRETPETPLVDHLINYTTSCEADFAMRRVGFYAGRVITENLSTLSETTHYFMSERTRGVIDTLRKIDWTSIASQTAGSRSLSKTEIAFKLVEEYNG